MKIFLPFLFTSLFFISLKALAQNLVSNPSFEIAHTLPQGKDNSINRSTGWIAPKYGSDYYYKGTGRHCGTPKNIFGHQIPHSGNAYAGICTRTHFLEYVETKLISPLEKDKEYLIEFYISKAEISLGSLKEFGVLFAPKTIFGVTERGIAAKPQVEFINRKGYRNKRKWIKLSAVYKAEGYETVLIIGHFNYEPSDDKRRILAHYYIDDVSVTPIEKKKDSIEITKVDGPTPKTFSPKVGQTITLQNIFFTTNKSDLLQESFLELDKLVQYLSEIPDTSIKISGHTDNSGNEDQNKQLSEARAKAVAVYLTSKGIDKTRISYIGYGSSKPIATNKTDEGKQQNRRVEFIISKI